MEMIFLNLVNNIIKKVAATVIENYSKNQVLLKKILTKIDTVQSTSVDDCVPKMIAHMRKAHPEMSKEQQEAVGIKKCEEKHGEKYRK